MMKYRLRDGIVLTAICDQHLLVAAEEARNDCPYVTRINETASYILKRLQEGYSGESLYAKICEDFDTDGEDIPSLADNYLNQLAEMGYLIREEE